MAPRNNSNSSDASEQLPEIWTLTNQRRKAEQEASSSTILSPARAPSASQSPKSLRKRTETPKSAAKTERRSKTPVGKKRKANEVDQSETKEAGEEPPVLTVKTGLRNPPSSKRRKQKPVIESKEEDITIETQDQQIQNGSIGKLATDKIFPHRLPAPPANEAPLSACSVASVATLVDCEPIAATLAVPGPSASASTSRRAAAATPLSTLSTTAEYQRSPQRTSHAEAGVAKRSTATLVEQTSNTLQSDAGSGPVGRTRLSNTKSSSETITSTSQEGSEPPTQQPPRIAASPSPEPADMNNDEPGIERSLSCAGSTEASEFSPDPNNARSLTRPDRIREDMLKDKLKDRKGRQRQVESEDELEESDDVEKGEDIAQESLNKTSSKTAKQKIQPNEDVEMASDTEEEEAEDTAQLQAPPSAQQKLRASSDTEGGELQENGSKLAKASKGRRAIQRRERSERSRDSGYVRSPLKASTSHNHTLVEAGEESDSSTEEDDGKKQTLTRPIAPAPTRPTRSNAPRPSQPKITTVRRLLLEEEHGETTEEEQEQEETTEQAEDEKKEEEAKGAEKRGSKRKTGKAQTTDKAENSSDLINKKEQAIEEKMAIRTSQRPRATVDYGPRATKKGNPLLKRKDTSESEVSVKSLKGKSNAAEADISSKGKDNKQKEAEKAKVSAKKKDWDKSSERSSQSTSRATRSSLRPTLPVKVDARFTSLSDFLEAAKKTLQDEMYNLSMSVHYQPGRSKVPLIDIECANYRGVDVEERAIGCNARITASATDASIGTNKVFHWTIKHAQDNHCTTCQDHNRAVKTAEVSDAEKVAFKQAQEILSDAATYRKFVTGRFTEEDIQKIEGNETSAKESSPAATAEPSEVKPAKDRSQKDPPTGRPASKPGKVIRGQEDDEEESQGDEEETEAQQMKVDEKVDQKVSQARGKDQALFPPKRQPAAKINYARKGGARRTIEPTPRNSISVDHLEESSSDEIEMFTSGFQLQRAGASLSKKPVAGEHPVKAANQRSTENETKEHVQVPQAASAAVVNDDAPSSDVPISPPLDTGRKIQAGASGPSRPPPSRRAKANLESPVSHTVAVPLRITAEKEVASSKPRSRAAPAGTLANNIARKELAPSSAAQVPQKRPPSSRGMAKRTGKKARLVKSSSDAEQEAEEEAKVKEGQSEPAQGSKQEAEDDDDDDSGEESSQEAPVTKKPITVNKKGKGKEIIRLEAQSAEQAEAFTSKAVGKTAAAVIDANQAEGSGCIKHEGEVQLSSLSLPVEMLDALQTSGGLFSLQDLLRKLKIRSSKAAPGASSDDINDEIKSILVKHRGAVLSGNFKISDEDALAVCIRSNQMGGIGRAAFLLEDAIYALPAHAKTVGVGN